jgi:hypothetical protein
LACGADWDRVDDSAIDELATVDLDRRKDSAHCRARAGCAHWIAARQQDALPRCAIACDCCARIVQVIEVTSIDDHRQELFEALSVEQSVPADRWAHELPPAQRLTDVGHLVDAHTGRVRETDDGTGTRSAYDSGPNSLKFQNAQNADVREAACSSATERQTDARHGLLSRIEEQRRARVSITHRTAALPIRHAPLRGRPFRSVVRRTPLGTGRQSD